MEHQNSSNSDWESPNNIVPVEHTTIIRNLRRRLWKSFYEENVANAIRAYTANIHDYEVWMQEEADTAEADRLQKEEEEKKKLRIEEENKLQRRRKSSIKLWPPKSRTQSESNIYNYSSPSSIHPSIKSKKQRSSSFRRLGNFGGSINKSHSPKLSDDIYDDSNSPFQASPTTATVVIGSFNHSSIKNDSTTFISPNDEDNNALWGKQPGLLQLHMNPSDPFVTDDYKSPYDSFETEEELKTKAGNEATSAEMIRNVKRIKNKRKQQENDGQPKPRLVIFGRKLGRQRPPSTTAAASIVSENISDNENGSVTDELGSSQSNNDLIVDANMTTPLHEAARLGSGTLLELMLNHGDVDPNYRNGKMRTALHMAAGGLTNEEEELLLAQATNQVSQKEVYTKRNDEIIKEKEKTILGPGVGIRCPRAIGLEEENKNRNDISENDDQISEKSGAKKAASAMGKFFRKSMRFKVNNYKDCIANNSSSDEDEKSALATKLDQVDVGRLNMIQNNRISAVLALLSWKHPDDSTERAGEGATVNSVDCRGRTALHYSAELGRSSICLDGILSDFNVILTVVDESGLTPCELAASHTHDALAYQLEARALLYRDPYGMDDELMASMLAEQQYNSENDNNNGADQVSAGRPKDEEQSQNKGLYRSKLVAPFSWFETWNMRDVRWARREMVRTTLDKMRAILREMHDQNEVNKIMFSHTMNDSLILDNGDEHGLLEGIEDNDCAAEMAANDAAIAGDAVAACLFDTKTNIDNNEKAPASSEPLRNSQENNSDAGMAPNDTGTTYDAFVTGTLELSKNFEENITTCTTKEACGENGTKPKDEVSEIEVLLDRLHECHVERYLQFHGWNRQSGIGTFKARPAEALVDAGICIHLEDTTGKSDRLVSLGLLDENDGDDTISCPICLEEYRPSSPEWTKLEGCKHEFCLGCLGDFISESALTKESGLIISCPSHNCNSILSLHEVQTLAPNKDVYDSLVKVANENFVTSAAAMRYCPHPGCEGIIRRVGPKYLFKAKEETKAFANLVGATCLCVDGFNDSDEDDINVPRTYEGVKDKNIFTVKKMSQPAKAHRFCFSCGEGVHWPVTCETLEEWKTKIDEEVGELGDDENKKDGSHTEDFNDLAQRLWMKANTRPCPQCKAPIEKNEGCNHMTCTNRSCRHEFCWICMKNWKLHNTETGGFYRCNKWQDEDDTSEYYDKPPEVPTGSTVSIDASNTGTERGYGTAVHAARSAWKKSRHMARFLHHYRRWTAHKESAYLERNMADSVCVRLAPVVDAAIDFNGFDDFDFGGKGLSFIHAAFVELLECRSFLQHSYAFAFLRYPTFYYYRNNRWLKPKEPEKKAFELMQSELEMLIEQLSDIVARSHLRATQTQIVYLTATAADKRDDMTKFMISVHDEMRKEKKRKSDEQDVQFGTRQTTPRQAPGLRPLANSRATAGAPNEGRDLVNANGQNQSSTGTSPTRNQSTAEEEAVREALRASLQQMNLGAAVVGADSGDEDGALPQFTDWACPACTYHNSRGRACAMCGTRRF